MFKKNHQQHHQNHEGGCGSSRYKEIRRECRHRLCHSATFRLEFLFILLLYVAERRHAEFLAIGSLWSEFCVHHKPGGIIFFLLPGRFMATKLLSHRLKKTQKLSILSPCCFPREEECEVDDIHGESSTLKTRSTVILSGCDRCWFPSWKIWSKPLIGNTTRLSKRAISLTIGKKLLIRKSYPLKAEACLT